MDTDDLVFDFNKLLIHPQFEDTIREISNLDVSLPQFPQKVAFSSNEIEYGDGELVTTIDSIGKVDLNPMNRSDFLHNNAIISGYDESIDKFDSLEGFAFFTSHSLVLLGKDNYLPVNYLTFYFYTKSKEIVNKSKYIKLSNDPIMDSQKDYIIDKIKFLEKVVPDNSIVLIDGPLIGGDVYTYMMSAIEKFGKKNIIPIFFVKNSSSNMVTDHIAEFKGRYNSDLHWAYNYLKMGQRTTYFHYKDKNNPKNAKVFCYLKGFNCSPQRVEIHVETFKKHEGSLSKIMDMIYYLLIVQGNDNNPQVRTIAVAEKYARETLKLINIGKLMKSVGVIPTMNENRFGR